MKKIVVGFNGTDPSRDALRLAETLRASWGGELVVAVVDDVDLIFSPVPGQLPAGSAYHEKVFAQAAAELGHDRFERCAEIGSAPKCLEVIAREVGADMIVVGSTHRSQPGQVLPGSVGERLLGGAPCPVAVAPYGYARQGHPTISLVGIGYDGSQEAHAALAVASGLAASLGASLRVIAATPAVEELTPGHIARTVPEHARRMERSLRAELDRALEECGTNGDVEATLIEGDPVDVLAEQSYQLDLLLLGSRGHAPLQRAVMGGVAGRVITRAACPVIVTPHSSMPARELPPPAGTASRGGREVARREGRFARRLARIRARTGRVPPDLQA